MSAPTRTSRGPTAALALLLAALAALACARGTGEPALDEAQRREWVELQRLQQQVARERAALAAQRARLAPAPAREQGAGGASQSGAHLAPRGPERAALERGIAERQRAVSELSHRFGSRLIAFLDSFDPLEAGASPPERRGAIRMKSDEDMAVAAEWIERGGDYRRAIEIYETQRRLDPDYEPLIAALRRAREMRQVSAERFAAVARGMTQDEVRAILGPVNLRLVRSFPERGVEAWLYPQERGGTAAVYFRREQGEAPLRVYETVFEVPSTEAPAAAGAGA